MTGSASPLLAVGAEDESQRSEDGAALVGDRTSRQGPLLKDLHGRPELSMLEERTRGLIAQHLTDLGYAVQHIGGGVVGVLENGPGLTAAERLRILEALKRDL